MASPLGREGGTVELNTSNDVVNNTFTIDQNNNGRYWHIYSNYIIATCTCILFFL